jgi:hypothetical protein
LINKGDLVRMKYITFWMKKSAGMHSRVSYTDDILIVLNVSHSGSGEQLRLMFPCGEIKTDLTEYYEKV